MRDWNAGVRVETYEFAGPPWSVVFDTSRCFLRMDLYNYGFSLGAVPQGGGRVSGGRVLLPIYADLARKPTFTLRRFERPTFTELPFNQILPRRAARALHSHACTHNSHSTQCPPPAPHLPIMRPIRLRWRRWLHACDEQRLGTRRTRDACPSARRRGQIRHVLNRPRRPVDGKELLPF